MGLKIQFVETRQPRGPDRSPLAATDYIFLVNGSECAVRVHLDATLTLQGQLSPQECEVAARTLIKIETKRRGSLAPDLLLDGAAMDIVAGQLRWLERFYRVSVSDFRSSVEEWQRASSVPPSELPRLSAALKDAARKLRVSEQDYRRALLAGEYGNKRQRAKARRLGEHVTGILRELGGHYALAEVLWDGDRLRWLLRIRTGDRVLGIPVPFELADDAFDAGILKEQDKLSQLVVSGLGRARRTA
jgi:hypothetical protein